MRILPVTAFLLIALAAQAEEPARSAAAPAVGRFYVVQGDGELRAEDPVRSGFAVGADERLSGPRDPARQVRVTGSPPGTTSTAVGVRRAPSAPRDEFAAFRCESFGFYFTTDGRCVAPARGWFVRPRGR